jgi:hypothetical protein
MNKVNTERLNASFPKLFQSRTSFGCRNGWFDLIYQLCVDITKECERLGLAEADWPKVAYVKEKFGCLRFIVRTDIDAIDELTKQAMNKSMTVCEVCGIPGKHYAEDCYRTLCDSCEAEHQKELKERWS